MRISTLMRVGLLYIKIKSNCANFLKDGSHDLTLVGYMISNTELEDKEFYLKTSSIQWIFNGSTCKTSAIVCP
jgi:hypothetical protein